RVLASGPDLALRQHDPPHGQPSGGCVRDCGGALRSVGFGGCGGPRPIRRGGRLRRQPGPVRRHREPRAVAVGPRSARTQRDGCLRRCRPARVRGRTPCLNRPAIRTGSTAPRRGIGPRATPRGADRRRADPAGCYPGPDGAGGHFGSGRRVVGYRRTEHRAAPAADCPTSRRGTGCGHRGRIGSCASGRADGSPRVDRVRRFELAVRASHRRAHVVRRAAGTGHSRHGTDGCSRRVRVAR
ncbi:MAG: hypothetical protein QOG22_904, partial [Pseudonocardiales bacterium]|nr:hypothetical protein [Pseudonocardiales bacterium]